jgi:hypothetical protein
VKEVSTVREIRYARSGAGEAGAAAATSASVALSVEGGEGRGLAVSFAARRSRPKELERRAAARAAETASGLPGELRRRLLVEVGEVRSVLEAQERYETRETRETRQSRERAGGGDRVLFARRYEVASCRGTVLGIRDGPAGSGGSFLRSRARSAGSGGSPAPAPFPSPWAGTMATGDLAAELPLVLTPSAVLALVSYALEVAGDHVAREAPAELARLTVIDTASSPYPPQHHPFEGDGTPAADRPLLEDGRWRDRELHAGEGVDPLFFLLTRPDRALRPLAAATHFNRRNLEVRWGGEASAPAPAVSVDSWRVRVGPRAGIVPFHAELAQVEADGTRRAVEAPVALALDPWEVLARVLGECGPPAPAVDEDPIEGASYGTAPALATSLTLAELLAASQGP